MLSLLTKVPTTNTLQVAHRLVVETQTSGLFMRA